MPADKIAITLDRELVNEIDRGVRQDSIGIAVAPSVREKLDLHRRRRLSVEARKLDRREEQALAEEGTTGERRRGSSTERRSVLG